MPELEPPPGGTIIDDSQLETPPGGIIAKHEEDAGMRDIAIALAKHIFGGGDALGVAKAGIKSLPGMAGPMEIPGELVGGLRRDPSEATTLEGTLANIGGRSAIPAVVGGATGMALGGPPAAAAGVVRGAAKGLAYGAATGAATGIAGETAGQLGAKALGGKQPFSPGEVAFQGALGGVIGAPLGAAAGAAKAFAGPVQGAETQSARILMKLADKYGITLTPADITKNRFLAALESFLEKTPLGGESIHKVRQGQIARLQSLKAEATAKDGTGKSPEVIGLALKERIKQESDQSAKAVSKLYDAAGATVPQETQSPTPALQSLIARLDKKYGGYSGKSQPGAYGILKDVFKDSSKGSDTVQGLLQHREFLGELIRDSDAAIKAGMSGLKFNSNTDSRLFKMAQAALDNDFDNISKALGGNFSEKYKVARTAARSGHRLFQDKHLLEMMRKDPEKIVDAVITPGGVSNIKAIRAAVGDSGFEDIRRAFISKLLKDDPERAFSPLKLHMDLEKYGEPTLREIFKTDPGRKGTESAIKQIKEIAILQRNLASAERLSPAHGSSRVVTFQALAASAASIPGAIIYGPLGAGAGAIVGTAAAALTPLGLAKLYSSKVGRDLLLKGMKTDVANKIAAKQIHAQIAAFVGKNGIQSLASQGKGNTRLNEDAKESYRESLRP